MKKLLFLGLAALSLTGFGQDFTYNAEVDSVIETGFYKILLSPEITTQLNPVFADIRLYKGDNEIPYLLSKETKIKEQELFVEYEIIEHEHFKEQRYTRIVIHNPTKTVINNIVLRIKNADVRKRLKLNASYNTQDWYVLKDNYAYNSIENAENSSEIRVLNFPLSDYEYYELLIDDYFDKPINITQAGYYNQVKEAGKYTQLQNTEFFVNDTIKESLITIPVRGNYIDKIAFEIDAPKYYYRQAEIFTKRKTSIKKRESIHEKFIGSFYVISNSANTFNVDNIKEDTIYVRIKNNDDSPLSISNIKLYQLNKYLTAELHPHNRYFLKYSDHTAIKPNYDLKYFSDSIPDNLPVIGTKTSEKLTELEELVTTGNFKLRNYWLWISIIFVAVLLIYMSVKMVKDSE